MEKRSTNRACLWVFFFHLIVDHLSVLEFEFLIQTTPSDGTYIRQQLKLKVAVLLLQILTYAVALLTIHCSS